MKHKLNSDFYGPALACGFAIALPYALKTFADGKYPNPIKPMLPMNFGEFSSFIPCVLGGAGLAYGALKGSTTVFVFGLASLVMGIINGVSASSARYSAPMQRPTFSTAQPRRLSQGEIEKLRMGRGTYAERLRSPQPVARIMTGRSENRVPKPTTRAIIRA